MFVKLPDEVRYNPLIIIKIRHHVLPLIICLIEKGKKYNRNRRNVHLSIFEAYEPSIEQQYLHIKHTNPPSFRYV